MNNQKNTRGRAILFSAIFLLLTPNAYASTALSLPVFPSVAPLPNLNHLEPDNIQLTDLSIEEIPSIASVKKTETNTSVSIQKGLASWYGTQFHGRKTASGARFDMHALTAAHRTLPLGTYVKVTNLKNGKTVVVKINDRGPYAGKRILDLSLAAANVLNFRERGETTVTIERLK